MKFGCLLGKDDDRDLIFSATKSKFVLPSSDVPDEYHIPEYTPVSNQLSLGSCVANAVGDALEILLGVEDPNSVEQISRLHLYYNARSIDHTTDKDDGTYIRNAIYCLKKLGVCPERAWPYDVTRVFSQPPLSAYKLSLDNKIDAYARIDSNRADSIESAIRANHPVPFATAVSSDYVNYYGRDDVVWDPPKSWVGMHAQIFTGVKRTSNGRLFRVRNSWGESWGHRGHTWFSEDYVESSRTNDLWIMTRVPGLIF